MLCKNIFSFDSAGDISDAKRTKRLNKLLFNGTHCQNNTKEVTP